MSDTSQENNNISDNIAADEPEEEKLCDVSMNDSKVKRFSY